MIRFHFTYNKDKMAQWLDEMDRQGWQLRRMAAGFCSFAPVKPDTYDYQIDYAGGSLDPGYGSLMADLGIEIVCRWGPWIVLRRPAADGPFELYTDADSRLGQLTKVRRFFKTMAALELLCTVFLFSLALAERTWFLLIFCGVGLAAAVSMIVRVRQIGSEMVLLGAPGGLMRTDQIALSLIGAGCVCIGIRYLLPTGSHDITADILQGFGIGLECIGLLRLWWQRGEP